VKEFRMITGKCRLRQENSVLVEAVAKDRSPFDTSG
jgi:hypothetical protein